MELLVTLSKKDYLPRLLRQRIDGIICGGPFSSRFKFSINELEEIIRDVKQAEKKFYLSIDTMIFEGDKADLYFYFEKIQSLDIDGIYFTDIGIIDIAEGFGLKDKLIYDGGALNTNTLDISFFLSQGIDGAVLAREITLDEDINIIKTHKNKLDMQIFGHTQMSTSKRKFVTNYLNYLGRNPDETDYEALTIIEEKREDPMPILEDKYGTRIYSDFVLEVYQELPYLNRVLKRGIIDDLFIEEYLLFDVIRDYARIDENNAEFLEDALLNKYKECRFGSGYLYQKTNLVKDNEQD